VVKRVLEQVMQPVINQVIQVMQPVLNQVIQVIQQAQRRPLLRRRQQPCLQL